LFVDEQTTTDRQNEREAVGERRHNKDASQKHRDAKDGLKETRNNAADEEQDDTETFNGSNENEKEAREKQ